MKKTRVITLMAAALVLIPSAYVALSLSNGSLMALTVLSGSMSPAMYPGDVIVVSETDPGEVRAGDLITFRSEGNYVTHRVVEIVEGSELEYRTKGDANEDPDSGTVSPENVVGKVALVIPKLGYLGSFVRTPLGYLLFILIPGALIVYSETRKILGRGKEKKIKKAGCALKESLLVVFVCFLVVSLASPAYAFFSDTEGGEGNTCSAGTLDFSLFSADVNFVPLYKADNMEYGDEVDRAVEVRNDGTLPFRYTARTEKVSGDDDLCNALVLEAKLEDTVKYAGDLMSYNLFAAETIAPPGVDTWHFKVSLPSDAQAGLQGKSCVFRFVFDGWQTDLDLPNGFSDEEKIENSIRCATTTTTTSTTTTTTTSTTSSTTSSTSTSTTSTTTPPMPVSEFPADMAIILILATPALAYLAVRRRDDL